MTLLFLLHRFWKMRKAVVPSRVQLLVEFSSLHLLCTHPINELWSKRAVVSEIRCFKEGVQEFPSLPHSITSLDKKCQKLGDSQDSPSDSLILNHSFPFMLHFQLILPGLNTNSYVEKRWVDEERAKQNSWCCSVFEWRRHLIWRRV
jgi:hypothetical protein